MLEHIRDLGAVRRARRLLRVLIEVVVVGLSFRLPGMQARPHPGMPAERRIARQIAGGLGNAIGPGGIGLKQAVGKRAVALSHARDVVGRGAGRRETGAFVGVVAHQDCGVVEPSGFVEPVLIVGNHPAIHDRPSHPALAARRFEHLLSRYCAQLFQRRRARRFREFNTRCFRIR